jgi:ATP-binding cassette subfamily C protein CydD
MQSFSSVHRSVHHLRSRLVARPLDPRLLQHAQAARAYVVLTALLGAGTAALVVAQALILAKVIASVVAGAAATSQLNAIAALIAIIVLRSVIAWAQDRYGHRAATAVIGQLRLKVLDHATRLGAAALSGSAGSNLATLSTRGLDALDGYLTKYLPQLLLAATVTPGVLIVVFWHDLISGGTILITLPLIPVFMAMVGWATQAAADRRLATMQRLGGQVLDLIAGLPTLRALGREHTQAGRVREVGDAYRRATMVTLRTAFLSALILESLTTLSVALVAVFIGMRLVYGQLDLQTGLAVLIMAPEVYLPLRMVGVHYHSSVDGIAAAGQAFAVLDQPVPARGTLATPDLAHSVLRLDHVSVMHDGRATPAPSGLSFEVHPGEMVALTGPSGAGKTTAVEVLLGLRLPSTGQASVQGPGGEPLRICDLDPESWFAQVAWVPQQPLIVPGSIADNVRLTNPGASAAELDRVAAAVGLGEVVDAAPQGWDTPIGQGGLGLSAGQRQRLALARALLRNAPVLVLDEPTAHLDLATEAVVQRVLDELRAKGCTVLVVAHRSTLTAQADRLVAT